MSGVMIAGADGCPTGWIVVLSDDQFSDIHWRVFPSIPELFERHPDLAVLAIDIPIGLPERGPRRCDRAARRLLGRPRGSSVFPAPIRPVLAAESYEEACRIGRATDGRGLTKQCWNIVDKIREVDRVMRERPMPPGVIREVHPEVSFCRLTGAPVKSPKKKSAGRDERLAALAGVFGDRVERAAADCRRQGAKVDDTIDAFAALWTARRIVEGHARVLPEKPQRDAVGLPMEIVA